MSEVIQNSKIRFTTEGENPKRRGSAAHGRFQKYMKAKTVQEYHKLGGTRADLRYDTDKGFVEILAK